MTLIQDSVYKSFNESKENSVNGGETKIKPYIFDTLQLIDKNRKRKLTNEEKEAEIIDICNKYRKMGNNKPNFDSIGLTNRKQKDISEEIQQKIQRSIELAAGELNIGYKYSQNIYNNKFKEEENENSFATEEEEEDRLDDFDPIINKTPPKPYIEEEEEDFDEAKSYSSSQLNNTELSVHDEEEEDVFQEKIDSVLQENSSKESSKLSIHEEEEEEDFYEEDSDDLFVEEASPIIIRRL